MEFCGSSQPSSAFPSLLLNFDEQASHFTRQPLSESAGNAVYSKLASAEIYRFPKGLPPPIDYAIPRYPNLPIVPSQSDVRSIQDEAGHRRHSIMSQPLRHVLPSQQRPRQVHGSLAQRKLQIQNQKFRESRLDPDILRQTTAYRQYRTKYDLKQCEDSQSQTSKEEDVWPDDLEDRFLDAYYDLPLMGKGKFSIGGKPHGRNELISLYMWIAYVKTLHPDEPIPKRPRPKSDKYPDEKHPKHRTRKQVSSHIQVLKKLMETSGLIEELPKHFKQLFSGRSAFSDFKSDPCLQALARGDLPAWRRAKYYYAENAGYNLMSTVRRRIALPRMFNLWISYPNSRTDAQPNMGKALLSREEVWHSLTEFDTDSAPVQKLEMLDNWRNNFPRLSHLHLTDNLEVDIIHMDVSLSLPRIMSLPARSSLCASFDVFIPGANDDDQTRWQSVTSLDKPPPLQGPSSDRDPLVINQIDEITLKETLGTGVSLRIPFPATQWAYAIQNLMSMQQEYDDSTKAGTTVRWAMSPREHVTHISMYQEVFSINAGAARNRERRAIILWTFDLQSRSEGKSRKTTWRHLDAESPPHQFVMDDDDLLGARDPLMSPPGSLSYTHRLPTATTATTTGSLGNILWAPDGATTPPSQQHLQYQHQHQHQQTPSLQLDIPGMLGPGAYKRELEPTPPLSSTTTHQLLFSPATVASTYNYGGGGGGGGGDALAPPHHLHQHSHHHQHHQQQQQQLPQQQQQQHHHARQHPQAHLIHQHQHQPHKHQPHHQHQHQHQHQHNQHQHHRHPSLSFLSNPSGVDADDDSLVLGGVGGDDDNNGGGDGGGDQGVASGGSATTALDQFLAGGGWVMNGMDGFGADGDVGGVGVSIGGDGDDGTDTDAWTSFDAVPGVGVGVGIGVGADGGGGGGGDEGGGGAATVAHGGHHHGGGGGGGWVDGLVDLRGWEDAGAAGAVGVGGGGESGGVGGGGVGGGSSGGGGKARVGDSCGELGTGDEVEVWRG